MKYRRYPNYKDSGVEWLGEVPEHWDTSKMKYLGWSYGGLTGKAGSDFNSDNTSLNKGFIPFTNIANNFEIRTDNLGVVAVAPEERQNLVQKNDLFFLMSSENREDLGKSSILRVNLPETYLNSFCKGFRISSRNIYPLFLNYLLSGWFYREVLSIEGNGFTRINLRLEKLHDLMLFLPPLPEQQQIASFLDKATNKIDSLIQKQERLIELLGEKRQAMISHAVTKGLNPDVPMKDSGVEWLGKVPEHWGVKKFKYLFSLNTGLSITRVNLMDKGIPCVNYGEVHSRYGFEVNADIDSLRFASKDYLAKSPKALVSEGGFIFADTSEDLDGSGNFSRVAGTQPVFAGYHTIVARNTKPLKTKFFAYLFDSFEFRKQIQFAVKGVKVFSITQAILRDSTTWLPPLSEQQQIASYLDEKTTKLDSLVEKAKLQINLLKEKRTALISVAVTGKIDVRGTI